jgi:hypothetical protein
VRLCCETLTSLSVDLSNIDQHSPPHRRENICFPQLYHLEICDLSSWTGLSWTIAAKTPNLKTYNEVTNHILHIGPIHKDTSTVVALRFSGSMDLSLFPSVCQVEPSHWCLWGTIARLYRNPTACPDLELIVKTDPINNNQPIQAKELIDARNALTGRTIRFGPKMQHGVFPYPGIKSHVGSLNYRATWVLTWYSSAAKACLAMVELQGEVQEESLRDHSHSNGVVLCVQRKNLAIWHLSQGPCSDGLNAALRSQTFYSAWL